MGAFDDIIAAHGDKQPINVQGRSLGSYTVSGPGQVTARPPDPYAGVEMKAGRTKLDSAKDFILGLMGKGGDFSSMVSPSMFTGVVANPRNAQLMKEALKSMIEAKPDMTAPELAINYMKLKYPKIASLVEGGFHVEPGQIPTVTAEGGMGFKPNPNRGVYYTNEKSIGLTNRIRPDSNYVETLGHEMTHAVQGERDPIGLSTAYLNPETLGFARYQDQPFEVNARQGGTTAKGTFEKFFNLMAGPYAQEPKTWTSVGTGEGASQPFYDVVLGRQTPPPPPPAIDPYDYPKAAWIFDAGSPTDSRVAQSAAAAAAALGLSGEKPAQAPTRPQQQQQQPGGYTTFQRSR